MNWQVEVLVGALVVIVLIGAAAYVVNLGGTDRRTRHVREHLTGMTGTTVTVVIGMVDDQELQSLSRVQGVVVGVQEDKLVLSPSDAPSDGVWVWPVPDGTVRVRLERILGIENADGEMVFT
jgi:hypothetical protein